jgi:AcrR family transcriptional regulator
VTARSALNRRAYVDAALDVIDDVGVHRLSMRNVAARLNVSPMAMYRHFPTKDDLLAASLEEFIARAEVIPDDRLHWEEWVERVARSMYEALCRELSWVPLLGSLRLGQQAIAVTAAFVEKLRGAGFSTEQSLRAYFAVIQVVVGSVCLRASFASRRLPGAPSGGDPTPPSPRDSDDTDSGRDILRQLQPLLRQDQIGIGLPLVIDSLRAQLVEANR